MYECERVQGATEGTRRRTLEGGLGCVLNEAGGSGATQVGAWAARMPIEWNCCVLWLPRQQLNEVGTGGTFCVALFWTPRMP